MSLSGQQHNFGLIVQSICPRFILGVICRWRLLSASFPQYPKFPVTPVFQIVGHSRTDHLSQLNIVGQVRFHERFGCRNSLISDLFCRYRSNLTQRFERS